MNRAASLHTATPTLLLVDPRGLALGTVGYCRQHADQPSEARSTRHAWNAIGQLHASRDPRGLVYQQVTHGLSGQALLSDSMDAGWKLRLPGESGEPLDTWDARGSHWRLRCDALLRPVEIGETALGGSERICERYTYATAQAAFAAHNQCGRLLRHDDPGGTLHLAGYSLGGALGRQTRHFLQALDAVDWPADPSERDALLESGAGFSTLEHHDASGQVHTRRDACGNLSLFGYGIDGRPAALAVQLAGAASPAPVLDGIERDAWGRVIRQRAGNGVVTQRHYDPATGRLTHLHCALPDQAALLDLHYRHDPLGNTLEMIDQSSPLRHFANQRIEPRCEYRHDTLDQLVEASGREFIGAPPGAGLPDLQPLPGDPARQGNYRQHYQYDAAGNLLQLCHLGRQAYTRTFTVAATSNRALVQDDPRQRNDFSEAFDAAGNLRRLLPGQVLEWNPRNQLERLVTLSRRDGADDDECYSHDAGGNRLRKVSRRLASGRTLVAEARYLPGLELRRDDATGEQLQVILGDGVEILHWEQGLPEGIDNDQQRYPLRDTLGTHTLELDGQAVLLSQELHYPFGGSAWWAAASSSQARYKYRRYAGKERDAGGLYYYGQRYYAPWLQRWLNPDPAGYVDGANLYRMVGNRPLDFTDWQGTVKIPLDTLLKDVLDPIARDLGNGSYEELHWDASSQGFTTSSVAYGRGGKVLESPPGWSLGESHAFGIFQDGQRLRLFANISAQHMGIQPCLGLPLLAGIIERGDNGEILFSNHSGHYKPTPTAAEVDGWLKALAPGASNVVYQAVEKSLEFKAAVRLESIDRTEDYVDKVAAFRRNKGQLIDFLKTEGLWEVAREAYGTNPTLNVIFDMHDLNLTIDQVHERNAAKARAEVRPQPVTRRKPEPIPLPNRQSKAITPRKSGGILGVFRACVGR